MPEPSEPSEPSERSEQTAVLTVDLAVLAPGRAGWEVLLVERAKPPHQGQWALPGGKVGAAEAPEAAALRELAEETGVRLTGHDLGPLSWSAAPGRDPRGRYAALAYTALLPDRPAATGGDDAARAEWWPLSEARALELAFDHAPTLRTAARLAPRTAEEQPRLRRPTPSDTDAVITLHHSALAAAGADAGPGPWDDDLEDIQGHYLDGGGDFVLCTLGGFLLGMGALRPAADGAAEVKRMRVHPSWQGRGLGRRILRHLEQRARELGYTALVLDTTADQRAAIALYRGNGFEQTGTGTVAGLPSLFFAKPLSTG